MKQFVLDYLANQCGSAERVVSFRRETDEVDLLIVLDDGKKVGVFVINRAIRLLEIKERYERNTRKGIYTLYIMDGRMMPEANSEVDPPHWMEALHTLMNGRIYAYWCDGRAVTIRPFHIEWKWGNTPRGVEYGDDISVNTLRAERVAPATKYIDGAYLSAHFGEGSFWKKRQPEDERQYRYSWRNWTYSERKREPDEDEGWDAWEEFNRQYGSTSKDDGEWEWTGEEFRQRPPRKAPAATYNQYYALLGVAATASMEEVKQAYRRKAREFHPDLHPGADKAKYTAKMADINAAFEAIVKRSK